LARPFIAAELRFGRDNGRAAPAAAVNELVCPGLPLFPMGGSPDAIATRLCLVSDRTSGPMTTPRLVRVSLHGRVLPDASRVNGSGRRVLRGEPKRREGSDIARMSDPSQALADALSSAPRAIHPKPRSPNPQLLLAQRYSRIQPARAQSRKNRGDRRNERQPK